MRENVAPQMQRLFIALWPPAGAARQLAEAADVLHAACGGRKIIHQNQHVTVVFLGDVNPARVPQLHRALRDTAGAGFDIEFDGVQFRRRGGLVWARATRVPDALDALVVRLHSALRRLGFPVDERRWVPHVTLLRDARRPPRVPDTVPVHWHAQDITLVRSRLDRRGARYDIVCRVPLTPGSST